MSNLVTNIQGYSIHDGPGIRTVVFLKDAALNVSGAATPNVFPRTLKSDLLKPFALNAASVQMYAPMEHWFMR